jgi:hypothetical protein
MSDPIATTSLELPGVIASAVQEVVSDSRGLGLTWTLRIATILITSPLTIIYDGDTDTSNAVSMIGPLAPLQRIYSLIVPPSGNFVVGCLNTTLGNMGANVCTAGTVATTPAGGAETAVPSASWKAEPVYNFDPQTIYKATVTGFMVESSGAGGAVCFIRIRKGSATTTGTALGLAEMFTPINFGGFTQSFCYVMYFKNSTSSVVRTKLSLTINGVVGAGTWSLNGDATNMPLALVVESVGSIVANPGLSYVPTF